MVVPKKQQVLTMLRRRKSVTVHDVVSKLNVSRAAAASLINDVKHMQGVNVVRARRDGASHYTLG